jgi:hypothetical protein
VAHHQDAVLADARASVGTVLKRQILSDALRVAAVGVHRAKEGSQVRRIAVLSARHLCIM